MNSVLLCVVIATTLISQASTQCYRVGLIKSSCSNIPDAAFNFSLIPGPQGSNGKDSVLCESENCNSYKRELKILTTNLETFAINIKKLIKENQEVKLTIKKFENFQRKMILKKSLEITRSEREIGNRAIWRPPVNKRERIWKTLRWSKTKNSKNKKGKKGKRTKKGKRLRRRKVSRRKLKRNRQNERNKSEKKNKNK